MKRIIYNLYSLLAIVFLAMACSPEEPRPIEESANKTAQLTGTWKIANAVQVDENAKFKGFPDAVTYQDITNILPEHPYTDFEITFSADGSYTVNPGRAMVNVPDVAGKWMYDNNDFPSAILLTGANGAEQKLDILNIGGLRYDNPGIRSLELGLIRALGSKAFLSYRYQMAYQTN